MKGVDKATLIVGGRRMIDIVIDRFRPYTAEIVISGHDDRGTGLTLVPDDPDMPIGPLGGLSSIVAWIDVRGHHYTHFYTLPVDTPCLPDDTLQRLSARERSAIAVDEYRSHPTIAYWRVADIKKGLKQMRTENSQALRRLSAVCNTYPVQFPASNLVNVNTPEDLLSVEQLQDNQ